jgi:DNA damage-inducible protein 1
MRITFNIYPGAGQQDILLTLEVFPDMTVATLRDSVQAETGIPQAAQHIYYNGVVMLDDTQTMEQLGITDGEMLAVHVRGSHPISDTGNAPQRGRDAASGVQAEEAAVGARSRGGEQDAEVIRLNIMGNPGLRQQLHQLDPELAAALDYPQLFAQRLIQSRNRELRQRAARHSEIERLNSDPFDVEAQAKIEEMIRQERVMENLQNAMEHNPEVFGRVHMLYLDVEVNGHKVKALVDSGAQATIMSPSCAEACNIMRLVDKRFAGLARGVGTAAIIGRVHSAQIKIGNLFLPCSFTVMEGKSVDLLLGLDMLKRHQACIDLAKDKLIIQGEEVPFLGEADIPKETEEALDEEPTIPGPSGTSIGQRTGAVLPPEGQPGSRTTTTSAPPLAASSSAQTPQSAAPTDKIEQLMAMGASREAAVHALQAAEGNLEVAAGFIFFGS